MCIVCVVGVGKGKGEPSQLIQYNTLQQQLNNLCLPDFAGLPKMLGLYRHCGIEVLVDADSGGNLIVQPSAVEKWLLMRHRTSAGNHSLTAYRDCMEACFDPEDLVLYLPKVRMHDRRKCHGHACARMDDLESN